MCSVHDKFRLNRYLLIRTDCFFFCLPLSINFLSNSNNWNFSCYRWVVCTSFSILLKFIQTFSAFPHILINLDMQTNTPPFINPLFKFSHNSNKSWVLNCAYVKISDNWGYREKQQKHKDIGWIISVLSPLFLKNRVRSTYLVH